MKSKHCQYKPFCLSISRFFQLSLIKQYLALGRMNETIIGKSGIIWIFPSHNHQPANIEGPMFS